MKTTLVSTYMIILLHTELLVSDSVVGEAGWSHHCPLDVSDLSLQPGLHVPHVIQDRGNHGDEEPPDEEHGLGPALLLGVPAVAHDDPGH